MIVNETRSNAFAKSRKLKVDIHLQYFTRMENSPSIYPTNIIRLCQN